jgi:hypothetical protein
MDVGGWRHVPAALPPGITRYPFYKRLNWIQRWSGRVRKFSPPAGFRSSDRRAHKGSLYRLPMHKISHVSFNASGTFSFLLFIVILLYRLVFSVVYCMFVLPWNDGKLTVNFFVSTCFSSMTSVLFGTLLLEAECSFSNFLLLNMKYVLIVLI